jgi:hypothetical protein
MPVCRGGMPVVVDESARSVEDELDVANFETVTRESLWVIIESTSSTHISTIMHQSKLYVYPEKHLPLRTFNHCAHEKLHTEIHLC